MDAAKPSSEGQPKTTANDSGTAAPKPGEGAAAPKRAEQMFVVQKSGPVPAGAAPSQPAQAASADAAKNAFQSAITQGTAAARAAVQSGQQPAGAPAAAGQPGAPANQPGTPASAGVPAGAKPGAVQAPRSQVPAPAVEAGLPELSEVEMRPDPLLSCLVILTRLFGNPKSLAALASGLPIGEAGMTPDLFVRAAENAGLSASKVRRGLAETKSINLPAVLLLKDRHAVVMLSPVKNGKVDVATTDNLDGIVTITAAELETQYSGTMLVVRPKIRLDSRSSEMTEAKERSWFWGEVMRHTPVYIEVVLAALLMNLFTIASSIFSMQVYDRVVPNKAEETLWVLVIGILLIYVFDFALRNMRAIFLDKAGKALDRKVSSAIFEHILSIKMAAGPQSSGAFASNVQQYETLRDFFTSASLSALIDLPFVLIFLLIIFFIAGPVVWVPAVLIPLVILVSVLVQFPMKRAVERSYRETSQKHATLVESINGLDMIKATSSEGQMQRNWDGYVAASSASSETSKRWSTFGINFVMLASNLATTGVILWGCYRIFQSGPTSDIHMTTGALIAASMLTSRAMAPLGQIAGLIIRFHQSWTSLKGLNRLMALPVERPRGKVFIRRPRIEGAIEFRNVSFKYPSAQTAALDGVSFKIQPGERVGILGRIGSGKTTIERLILGLYEPSDGAVLVDGTDIRQLDPTDLRQNIGCVLQDPHLFYGSVKDNITLGAPYVDEASVIRAATLAGVDQFVRQHPLGYDMPVGENGRMLSGGQRQSVAVARALLLNPQIMVFDEPTSSMDNSTEAAFKQRLGAIARGKTIILVTHRHSMLALVDRLIVLDRGKVVADGPKSGVLEALMGGRVQARE
ncbi:MAG TPA: type I secretion system permease/ATPase [Dongiaceae bacterium]|nr:type I secretion system permease/ATPase [Dongiaceae bacterium]